MVLVPADHVHKRQRRQRRARQRRRQRRTLATTDQSLPIKETESGKGFEPNSTVERPPLRPSKSWTIAPRLSRRKRWRRQRSTSRKRTRRPTMKARTKAFSRRSRRTEQSWTSQRRSTDATSCSRNACQSLTRHRPKTSQRQAPNRPSWPSRPRPIREEAVTPPPPNPFSPIRHGVHSRFPPRLKQSLPNWRPRRVLRLKIRNRNQKSRARAFGVACSGARAPTTTWSRQNLSHEIKLLELNGWEETRECCQKCVFRFLRPRECVFKNAQNCWLLPERMFVLVIFFPFSGHTAACLPTYLHKLANNLISQLQSKSTYFLPTTLTFNSDFILFPR